MARGIGEVEGWAAVALVAGLGAALVLAAGVLWFRARSAGDAPPKPDTYRTAPARGTGRAAHMRGLAIVLLSLCALTQLLYVGVYVELAQWLFGATEPPAIFGDLYFWVALVDITCVGGALYTGLKGLE